MKHLAYESSYGIVSESQHQNARPYQEDRSLVLSIRSQPGEDHTATLKTFFESTHATIEKENQWNRQGSTLTAVWVSGTKVTIANLGDSPCILALRDKDGTIQVVQETIDHNTSTKSELDVLHAEAPDSGVYIYFSDTRRSATTLKFAMEQKNAQGNLYLMNPSTGLSVNLTRTLGDLGYPVRRDPDIKTIDLEDYLTKGLQVYLMVASDGISETLSGKGDYLSRIEEAIRETTQVDLLADSCINGAIQGNAKDNVTLLCLAIDPERLRTARQKDGREHEDLLMVVADGHGGADVAQYLVDTCAQRFQDRHIHLLAYEPKLPDTVPCTPESIEQNQEPVVLVDKNSSDEEMTQLLQMPRIVLELIVKRAKNITSRNFNRSLVNGAVFFLNREIRTPLDLKAPHNHLNKGRRQVELITRDHYLAAINALPEKEKKQFTENHTIPFDVVLEELLKEGLTIMKQRNQAIQK